MTPKDQYLAYIRSNSAYPTYRGFIGVLTILGYIMAGLCALGALVGGVTNMNVSMLVGLLTIVVGGVFAVIMFVLVRFYREAAFILADLADASIEMNSRYAASGQR